jgi:hypothetical protein
MTKTSRFIIIAAACCVLMGLLFFIDGRSTKLTSLNRESSRVNSTPQELTFRHIMVFDGKLKDGARYANNIYKSSDCVTISYMVIFFKTRDRAHEVQAEAKKASELIERGSVMNEAGRQVGERVVLQFEASDKDKAHAEVIWNKDKDFYSLTAPSLHHALEFERSFDSQSGRISSRIDDVKKVSFTPSETRDGRTEAGFGYSEKQFRSSDCETVISRTEYFPSPARAQEELVKKLEGSTNIIERAPKLDATGQQVGERVVAMFRADSSSEYIEETVVMWTFNSELHSLRGLFTHVLELERRK